MLTDLIGLNHVKSPPKNKAKECKWQEITNPKTLQKATTYQFIIIPPSDESQSSSNAESATSSPSTTSDHYCHSMSSSTDQRGSRGRHDKHRYTCTSHTEEGCQKFMTTNMADITIVNRIDITDPELHHHPALALRTTALPTRVHVMPMIGYQPLTPYPPSLKNS